MSGFVHQSVLADEVLELLAPAKPESLFVDATLGEGGHAELLLEHFPGITLYGVERNAAILEIAAARLARFGTRAVLFNRQFASFFAGVQPDRVLFDLGISMYHLKRSGLGFSFQEDEPLDMRLDQTARFSAGEIVNTFPAGELERIFRDYGEERLARGIARALVARRSERPFATARDLADVVACVIPARMRRTMPIHPATRVFQALRIAVNNELENLEAGLAGAFAALKPAGRIGVIAYHSLEDREVKHFFRDRSGVCTCPPEFPVCQCSRKQDLVIVTKKPVSAGDDEVQRNHAARSARFRVAEKL